MRSLGTVTAIALMVGVFGLAELGSNNKPTEGASPSPKLLQTETAGGEDTFGAIASDYFPLRIGSTWTYRINLGTAEPTKYEEVLWPMGQGAMISAVRGRFWPAMKRTRDEFTLRLRVNSRVSSRWGDQFRAGFEVGVLQDDLGVFFETDLRRVGPQAIFIAVTDDDRYRAFLVIPHDPDEPGAPSFGGWGGGPGNAGYSLRPFFFGATHPGVAIGIGEKPSDTLLFAGTAIVPGSQGVRGLHFIREVDRARPERSKGDRNAESNPLDQGFTEDMWFARGRGLVMLVQRRGGNVTMTWVVADYAD